jgi:predicted PurR-regulated permease PerM
LQIKSRGWATAVAYLLVIAILVSFIAMIVPPLVRQTRTFIGTVPDTIQNFQQQDSKLARAARRYHVDQKITQSAKDFASHYSNYGSTILDTGRRILEAFTSILVVLVMTFMMLVEGPRWLDLFWGVMPTRNRNHQVLLMDKSCWLLLLVFLLFVH